MILADSFGELEQLQRRKDDKEFLRAYLRDMQEVATFRKRRTILDKSELNCPEAFLYYSEKIVGAWVNHIQCGRWNGPPQSVDELSERVDFLLSKTIIDEEAEEIITGYEYMSLFGEGLNS